MSESSKGLNPGDIDVLFNVRRMWSKDSDYLITEQQTAELLSSPQFSEHVAEAIRRTDQIEDTKTLLGEEYGFIGYRHPWALDGQIHLTPLFKGDESSINIGKQANSFLKTIPYEQGIPSISFHTHPWLSSAKLSRLVNEIMSQSSKRQASGYRFPDYFSRIDLEHFKNRALDDPSFILALGIRATEHDTSGRVLLTSFGTLDAIAHFDPLAILQITAYKKIPGKNHLDAYIEAGLNVALLDVNLQSTSHLKADQITRASQALTTRKY